MRRDSNRAPTVAQVSGCADEKPSVRIIDCARMKSASVRNRRSWIEPSPRPLLLLSITVLLIRMRFLSVSKARLARAARNQNAPPPVGEGRCLGTRQYSFQEYPRYPRRRTRPESKRGGAVERGEESVRRFVADHPQALHFPALAVEENDARRPEQAEALEQCLVLGRIGGDIRAQ